MKKHWKVDVTFPVQSVWKDWGFRESVIWGCSEANADKRLTDSTPTPTPTPCTPFSIYFKGENGKLFRLQGATVLAV